VTNCAGLPNYFLNRFILQFKKYFELPTLYYCATAMYMLISFAFWEGGIGVAGFFLV
jgi:hypothetical protein